MANVNAPRGLIPYRHFDGSYWNGSANIYYAPTGVSTNLYIGDPISKPIADSNDANGIPAVKLGVVNSPIIGAMVGIVSGGQPVIGVTRDLNIYRSSAIAQYILVSDDPTLMYWIQDDGATPTIAPKFWAGRTASLTSAVTGSTITGYSGWQLATTTVALSAGLDLFIMRPLDQADNAVGVSAVTGTPNTKWLVKLNNYGYVNAAAGITA